MYENIMVFFQENQSKNLNAGHVPSKLVVLGKFLSVNE